jgi:pyrroloquinoline-quinone synthase
MTPTELEAAIRAVGAERYHDKHPFHRLLHGGKLDKGQVQAWALNRYCYQAAVPRKDAALISRVHDRELRREWAHRIQAIDVTDRGRRGGRHRALAGADRRAGSRPHLRRLHAGCACR